MDDGRRHGYETADPFNYALLKNYAEINKLHQTLAECLLWDMLSKNRYKFKFRRQHVIGYFIADFVCLNYGLVIEVDGGYHSQYEQQIKDNDRTGFLNDAGFSVIRLTNEEVEASPKAAAERIFDEIFKIIETENEQ